MKIHKEGSRILITTLILIIALLAGSRILWANTGFIIALILLVPQYIFMLRFFRVPKRNLLSDVDEVVAPCDGKVVVIEEVDEPEFLKTRCIQVSIFMSVWNVHINWFPISGKVVYQKHHQGKYLVAWEPKSSTVNERTTVAIENSNSQTVLLRQVAGYVARRIVCYAKEGINAEQGKELGFIKFGSRVDLYFPLGTEINVGINQKVVGGQSLIASLPK